jgi:Mrp family chromosome partitioning ATPase
MIVEKAVKMASLMDIPILGMIENMSYFKCPGCNQEHRIYGDSHIDKIAETYGIKVLGNIPIKSTIARCIDKGTAELLECEYLDLAAKEIEAG